MRILLYNFDISSSKQKDIYESEHKHLGRFLLTTVAMLLIFYVLRVLDKYILNRACHKCDYF